MQNRLHAVDRADRALSDMIISVLYSQRFIRIIIIITTHWLIHYLYIELDIIIAQCKK